MQQVSDCSLIKKKHSISGLTTTTLRMYLIETSIYVTSFVSLLLLLIFTCIKYRKHYCLETYCTNHKMWFLRVKGANPHWVLTIFQDVCQTNTISILVKIKFIDKNRSNFRNKEAQKDFVITQDPTGNNRRIWVNDQMVLTLKLSLFYTR